MKQNDTAVLPLNFPSIKLEVMTASFIFKDLQIRSRSTSASAHERFLFKMVLVLVTGQDSDQYKGYFVVIYHGFLNSEYIALV